MEQRDIGDSTLLSNHLIHVIGKLNSERIDKDLSKIEWNEIFQDNTEGVTFTSKITYLRVDTFLRYIINLLNSVEEFYTYNEDEYIDINNFYTCIIINKHKLTSIIRTILREGNTKRKRMLVSLIRNIGKQKCYRLYKFRK